MSTPSTPRPNGSAPKSEAPRPAQVKRPATSNTGSRPAAGGARPAGGQSRPTGQRPTGGQQRPATTQERLVRPAPQAKVRKARLLVSKVEPFSVLKLAFLLAVAFGVITVVASVGIWALLDLMGTFDAFNQLIRDAIAQGSFDLRQTMSLGQVASYATIIAVVNVVVISVVSTLGAVLYNIAASLVGGIGVTLTDD
ncbi:MULTISPECIES: DUF3566 domain-containing protein [Micrococcaceae]|uniref:DUF3566 domain-containing protein n=1 Tax=Micrococcaceae TaxID=1268 RepID=UPI0010357B91|nr:MULTISPECIES: DUF3566 domain-containing protein [Micrococcaceae]TAP28754.1 DUF3566 domain-containing protein [Arthrobacter sp. S41]UXN32407.1 DUF3566 domain-containing protein [Glutamicibacter sp. M10]